MHISSERRITLNNVKKSDEGSYVCDVQVVRRSQRKIIHYSLRVNGLCWYSYILFTNIEICRCMVYHSPGYSVYFSIVYSIVCSEGL